MTTPAATAAATCDVRVLGFGGGFAVQATITDGTAAPVDGWTLRFTLPVAVRVSQSFRGVLTRTGDDARMTPMGWNGVIAPGARVRPGFEGAGPTGLLPGDFSVNGLPCTVHG